MTAQREAIIREIYKAVKCLEGSRELLAVIGSWGDTLSDDEVLEALQRLNAGRRLFDEVFASTGGPAPFGTSRARRSTEQCRR
jgi:hypothetical protein